MKEQSVSDTTQQASGQPENEETKNVVSYETHARLLGQRKKDAEKTRALEAELEDLKINEASREGKKDDVIEALRKQLAEVREDYDLKTKAYATTTVKGQIKSALLKKGCVSPDKALRLMERDDLNSIQLDDDFSVNLEDLDRVIDKFQKENEDLPLFNKVSGVSDLTPTNQVEYKEKQKEFSEMSKEELLNEAKNLGGLF